MHGSLLEGKLQAVQSNIVVIEVCMVRTNLLQLDEDTILEEAQSINLDKRSSGAKGWCRG